LTAESEIQSLYLPKFNDDQYINELIDTSLVISLNQNPNYSNIKNDFTCWGSRKSPDGDNTLVRYHLAIDHQPIDSPEALCHRDIRKVINKETEELVRYQFYPGVLNPGEIWGEDVAPSLDSVFPYTAFDWREELFRKALISYGSSTHGSYYDEELMAEWRALFDPTSTIIANGSRSFE
jgi:hypothetical protein